MMVPKISVIIVTYNSAVHIVRCIESVVMYAPGCEIIVVDNASSDETMKLVREKFPAVNVIVNESNLGYAAAINRGFSEASGDVLAILNPDTEVKNDVLTLLADKVRADSKLGVVGSRLIFPDGSAQRSFFNFPSLPVRLGVLTGLNKMVDMEKVSFLQEGAQAAIDVDVVCGAFMVVRRDLFESVNGFDEDYFLYHEEGDFCYRLKKVGFINRVFLDQQIVHYGDHQESLDNPVVYYHRNRSLLIYFLKHTHATLPLIVLNCLFLTFQIVSKILIENSEAVKILNSVLKMQFKFLPSLINGKIPDIDFE